MQGHSGLLSAGKVIIQGNGQHESQADGVLHQRVQPHGAQQGNAVENQWQQANNARCKTASKQLFRPVSPQNGQYKQRNRRQVCKQKQAGMEPAGQQVRIASEQVKVSLITQGNPAKGVAYGNRARIVKPHVGF